MTIIDNAAGAAQSASFGLGQVSRQVNRLSADLGLGGVGGPYKPAWLANLRPASWRGVPFGVDGGEGRFGRRNVVHEYPYRDSVWVEDLGRIARRIGLMGFLLGPQVFSLRDRMIAAAEAEGDGELVHPTLGRLRVSLEGPLIVAERKEWGGYVELRFQFIEPGQRVFPAITVSTGAAVKSAAAKADAAASGDFATRAAASLRQGAAVVAKAATTAAIWARKAQRLGNDATNLYHTVTGLPGNTYGRYFGGRRQNSMSGAANSIGTIAGTIGGLIALGSLARAGITAAAGALNASASGLGTGP